MRLLLHISDVHFGPPHLPAVAEGVLELIERRSPNLVIVSGDLTQRAKPRQFREARRFVDRIPVPTLTVPGNHDVPMYRFWERFGDPYGAYRKHFSPELEPVHQDEGLFVLGLNTAHNMTVKDGRISRSRLLRAEEQLAAAPEGATRLVVAHHPLVPAPRFDTQRVLVHAYETVRMLSRAGVELVLSGHLHQTYIASSETYYPSHERPVLLLQAGTTTSDRGRGSEKGKNTCNWIEIREREIRISHLLWDGERRGFVERSRHFFPRHGFYEEGMALF